MGAGAHQMNEVQKASKQLERAKFALAVAVRKAHGEGVSLRKLAEDAQMSHESVRRLISQDQPSRT